MRFYSVGACRKTAADVPRSPETRCGILRRPPRLTSASSTGAPSAVRAKSYKAVSRGLRSLFDGISGLSILSRAGTTNRCSLVYISPPLTQVTLKDVWCKTRLDRHRLRWTYRRSHVLRGHYGVSSVVTSLPSGRIAST